jgi:hypothetical protein
MGMLQVLRPVEASIGQYWRAMKTSIAAAIYYASTQI